MTQSKTWLDKEDKICRSGRIKRLDWLANKTPKKGNIFFFGGETSKYLYDEARYCFVYAQFLATIVLGFAFIEHTLAALFYAAGRDDLERANVSLLLKEACNQKLISKAEYKNLNRAKYIRNPITHFRKPLDGDTISYRSLMQNKFAYGVIEKDAKHVMKTVFHLLNKYAV
ncbi:MAG: hypothetical protein HY578_02160 [Nitrospinae bacterium]|nr:hypothetical protein [Nitrospinota bacterium]